MNKKEGRIRRERFSLNLDARPSVGEEGMNRRCFLKKSFLGLVGGVFVVQKGISKELFDVKVKEESDMSEFFRLKRVKEAVHHYDGRMWNFHSIAEDGEYYPSFSDALFQKKETLTSSDVCGGFLEDLHIFSQYGMFSQVVPKEKVSNLLFTYSDSIFVDPLFQKMIVSVSQDYYVFVVLKQFFADGGTIRFGKGRYSPKPLEIFFGDHGESLRNESIFYHELLHYVFDKENSVLSECNDESGADHFVIHPLEERLNILRNIFRRKAPFSEDIESLYGSTAGEVSGDKISQYVQVNDLKGLKKYVMSDDFYVHYVHSGMMFLLEKNEDARKGHVLRLQQLGLHFSEKKQRLRKKK